MTKKFILLIALALAGIPSISRASDFTALISCHVVPIGKYYTPWDEIAVLIPMAAFGSLPFPAKIAGRILGTRTVSPGKYADHDETDAIIQIELEENHGPVKKLTATAYADWGDKLVLDIASAKDPNAEYSLEGTMTLETSPNDKDIMRVECVN